MFEVAELGRKVDKQAYAEQSQSLRLELLALQQQLGRTRSPLLLVFAGVDGAGKSETTNRLKEWMDSRYIVVHAYGPENDVERERPEFWRYWHDLPKRGRTGVYLSSWYSRPVLDWVYGRSDDLELHEAMDRIVAFERTLVDDGALVVKFWMHLTQKHQRKRLESLEADPLEAWRVTDAQWRNYEHYDRFLEAAERTIRATSKGDAPWHIVEGTQRRYRELATMTHLRDALRSHLERPARRSEPSEPGVSETSVVPRRSVLQDLDLTPHHDRSAYKKAMKEQGARLGRLVRQARDAGVRSVLVFEGWDAAGKGGVIKRLIDSLDARQYRAHPIGPPTDEERLYHWLWRFWKRLGGEGRVTLFDRSWYGRVLVERIEGFASEREWKRAYEEIRQFEEQLVEGGHVLCKFWLHITPDEQLARFELREQTPHKRWKLTDEDWRNREKWGEYEEAVDDMV
ncbi:MAG: polyphosphate:AMP phosphotransferase, partial [Myxococcota bacterium]